MIDTKELKVGGKVKDSFGKEFEYSWSCECRSSIF